MLPKDNRERQKDVCRAGRVGVELPQTARSFASLACAQHPTECVELRNACREHFARLDWMMSTKRGLQSEFCVDEGDRRSWPLPPSVPPRLSTRL
jgi:hypothetical protein